MKLTLVGYGGLNQLINTLALQKGHEVVARISPSLGTTLFDIPRETEVVIDCSTPAVIMDNMKFYAENDFKAVIGTTGWYDQIDEVKNLFESSNGALLWASNFALGVHLYFRILGYAAEQMNKFEEYDVFGREIHHKNKKDSPSGTTLSAAKVLLSNLDRKTQLVTEELTRKIENHELHFSSTRGGFVNFSHEVFFDSTDETIVISHSARNRNIYAKGAISAAEWLAPRTGYFSMDEWVDDILS